MSMCLMFECMTHKWQQTIRKYSIFIYNYTSLICTLDNKGTDISVKYKLQWKSSTYQYQYLILECKYKILYWKGISNNFTRILAGAIQSIYIIYINCPWSNTYIVAYKITKMVQLNLYKLHAYKTGRNIHNQFLTIVFRDLCLIIYWSYHVGFSSDCSVHKILWCLMSLCKHVEPFQWVKRQFVASTWYADKWFLLEALCNSLILSGKKLTSIYYMHIAPEHLCSLNCQLTVKVHKHYLGKSDTIFPSNYTQLYNFEHLSSI